MSSVDTAAPASDPVHNLIDLGRFSSAQFMIVLICMLLNMSDGFDVLAMAYTAGRISDSLNLAPGELGIVFSTALAGMMIGAMVLAPLADIYGRRIVVFLSVLVIGTSMLLTATVSSLSILILLRLIAGLGVGAILAGLAAMASEYSPTRYKSLVVVSITVGYPLGGMLAGLIASHLIPTFGWHSMFLLGGIVNFLLALLVWFYLPESVHYLLHKRPSNALEKINTILIRIGKTAVEALPALTTDHSHTSQQKQTLISNMKSLLVPELRNKTLLIWSTFFLCFICLYFLLSWIPKLLLDAGFTEQQGVWGGTAFNLGAVIGVIFLGYLSTRFSLSTLIGLFLTSSGLLMVVYAFTPSNITLLLSIILLIGILQQGGFTGLYAVAAKVYPTRIKATGIGWAIGLGRFGAVVGPMMAGIFVSQGISMEMNFMLFAIPMILGGMFAYMIRVQ